MSHHRLKIYKHFADAIEAGDKNFEVRKNERGYQRGDTVSFRVGNEIHTNKRKHPIEDRTFEITYVLSGWGIEPGYVVFGIEEIEDTE